MVKVKFIRDDKDSEKKIEFRVSLLAIATLYNQISTSKIVFSIK